MDMVKHPKVPESVSQHDLQESLEPFYRLLGISPHWVYSSPGITIDHDAVRFVAVPERVEDDGNFPEGTKALPHWRHPQDVEFAELLVAITVKVEHP